MKIKPIILVLLIALIARLIFFFSHNFIWWDGAVYVGMGRYLFSLGQAGLWEPIRPILLPFILGILWKTGLSEVFFGRILMILLSLASVYFTYLIGKIVFNKRSAVISCVLFSFSAISFFFAFRLYTETIAIFFVLLGIYMSLKKRFLLSGIFIGAGFLSKFPAGMFIACILAAVLFGKRYSGGALMALGFLIAVVPYLVFNFLMYGNMLLPFFDASSIIGRVLGCNYIRYNPWWYYFVQILKDNILNIFVISGIWFSAKNLDKKKLLILLCLAVPMIYFSQMHCREYRYMILFIPFVNLFAGYGIYNLVKRFRRHVLGFVVLAVIVVSAAFAVCYYFYNPNRGSIHPEIEQFYRFAEGRNVSGELWTTNPVVALYVDKKVNLLYYPVYDANRSLFFEGLVNRKNISYIFLDDCGGGMICPEDDDLCRKTTARTIEMLENNFEKKYFAEVGRCKYYVFESD